MENVCKFFKGRGISKEDLSDTGNPCILYGELYTTYKTAIAKTIKSRTLLDLKSLVHSKSNDVLIPCSGETAEDISTSICIPYDDVLIGGDLTIIRSQLNGAFLSNQINSVRKLDIARIAQGKSIVHLQADELKKINISFPTIDEQLKIATFVDLLDQRIDTQSKIIEDLELCKKKICYEIFSAKESYVKPLGSIISYGKAGGTPASTNKSYYNGNIPFLSISDMTEQGKYILRTEKTLSELGLKNSSAWLVPKNSLILSMYASVGFVSISKVELATSQAMFSMIIEDKNLLEYVYYYLNYFKSFKIHRLLETGTQSNINAEMVKNINIPFFDQTKNLLITQFFNNFDLKIKKEKDILELYKKQKAYLLKNMFI